MKGLLWQPGRLGPVELRNRTIRSATNEHLSQPDGQLTQAWAETLAELARNEVGLVITGHLCVDRSQRADEGQPVLDSQTDRALLAQAAEEVHRAGGRIAAQLSHSGKKAMEAVNGRPAKAPEDFSPEELDRLREAPLPAVVPIPGISGNTGLGLRQVKRSVEQAVGSDILANES